MDLIPKNVPQPRRPYDANRKTLRYNRTKNGSFALIKVNGEKLWRFRNSRSNPLAMSRDSWRTTFDWDYARFKSLRAFQKYVRGIDGNL